MFPNPTINRTAKGIFYEHEYSTITVKLSAVPCSEVKVLFKTVDDSAISFKDYVPVVKTFTFAPNTTQLSQQVKVHGWSDNEQEGFKNFHILFSNPTGGATISSPTSMLTVDGAEPQ